MLWFAGAMFTISYVPESFIIGTKKLSKFEYAAEYIMAGIAWPLLLGDYLKSKETK